MVAPNNCLMYSSQLLHSGTYVIIKHSFPNDVRLHILWLINREKPRCQIVGLIILLSFFYFKTNKASSMYGNSAILIIEVSYVTFTDVLFILQPSIVLENQILSCMLCMPRQWAVALSSWWLSMLWQYYVWLNNMDLPYFGRAFPLCIILTNSYKE